MAINALLPTSLWTLPSTTTTTTNNTSSSNTRITPTLFHRRHHFRIQVNSSDVDAPSPSNEETPNSTILPPPISEKDLKKAVLKTAATFAPRASTATKNPAVPGSTLYTVFEVQGYATMLLGGALSFNLIFPSTIPSLRARDCSKNEKEALNYLFILVPLLNVAIPFFVKSFAVVWSADTAAFFAMYAWKMEWLKKLK